jgi:hypothetical protein
MHILAYYSCPNALCKIDCVLIWYICSITQASVSVLVKTDLIDWGTPENTVIRRNKVDVIQPPWMGLH